MIRNFKALGLALVAAFAFSAVATSTASAQAGKLTSTGPVTLTGEDTGPNIFHAFGGEVECPNSTYTGHKVRTVAETAAGAKHELLPVNSTAVTVTPHYKQVSGATANCDTRLGGSTFSATVTMNGCDYRFHTFATKVTPSHPQHTYTFLTDIVCPAGAVIAVHVYFSHTHTAANECATITVGPQTNRPGGTATTTTAADDIDLTGTITGIAATKHSKSILCPEETTTSATYTVDVTVKGHNAAKENTNVTITD